MLDLVAAEFELLTRLRAVLGDVPALAYPGTNRDGDLPPLMQATGEIYVRWLGDALPAPLPNNRRAVEQLVATQWETLVRTKSHAAPSKGPHHNGYELVKRVSESLTGFTLATGHDASVLYPVRRQFIGESEGLWTFSVIWQFTHQEATAMLAEVTP
jgi:hypothetical protein